MQTIAAYRRTHTPSQLAWSWLAAVLHSSNEQSELSPMTIRMTAPYTLSFVLLLLLLLLLVVVVVVVVVVLQNHLLIEGGKVAALSVTDRPLTHAVFIERTDDGLMWWFSCISARRRRRCCRRRHSNSSSSSCCCPMWQVWNRQLRNCPLLLNAPQSSVCVC